MQEKWGHPRNIIFHIWGYEIMKMLEGSVYLFFGFHLLLFEVLKFEENDVLKRWKWTCINWHLQIEDFKSWRVPNWTLRNWNVPNLKFPNLIYNKWIGIWFWYILKFCFIFKATIVNLRLLRIMITIDIIIVINAEYTWINLF